MQYLISKVTGKLLAVFQPSKTKTIYKDITAIVLPSGTIVQLYTTTQEDEYLIQVDSHIIY